MRPLLLTLLLTPALSGCVSYWRGQEMDAEMKALEGRMDQQSEELQGLRSTVQQEMVRVAAQLVQTEKKLVEAIERLQSGNADNMLIIQQLREELNTARGELAKLEHNMQGKPAGLPDVANGAVVPEGPKLPEEANELYGYGYERKQAGDCPEAVRAFSVYAQKFPKESYADNSLYLLAECQFEQKEHTASIRTLQTVMKAYSSGDKVDDALELMHDNFVALGRCRDAVPFLETLIAEYPRSKRVKAAKKKLKRTKRNCK